MLLPLQAEVFAELNRESIGLAARGDTAACDKCAEYRPVHLPFRIHGCGEGARADDSDAIGSSQRGVSHAPTLP